ncbi:MAG: biphenyl 2,3-dioxygenase [Rhodospirillales bacterium]|nr:biphenyl 2,3-dioxygenase [Rhodospirillales bacterium]
MTMPSPKLAHVVYRTRQLDAMLQWYAEVFGARIVYRNPALAFAAFDEDHHRLAFADLSVIAPECADTSQAPVGLDHVAYEFASLTHLLERWEDLKAKGIEPYWCVNHGISASLYYADPDGNQMEFSVDCFASKDECRDYFAGAAMGQNPVGIEYDPADWLARLRAGESEAALLAIDRAAPVSPIRGQLQSLTA